MKCGPAARRAAALVATTHASRKSSVPEPSASHTANMRKVTRFLGTSANFMKSSNFRCSEPVRSYSIKRSARSRENCCSSSTDSIFGYFARSVSRTVMSFDSVQPIAGNRRRARRVMRTSAEHARGEAPFRRTFRRER